MGMKMRKEVIGDATIYLGNSLEIMPSFDPVNHIIMDPPYEESLHKSKNSLRGRIRTDTGPDLQGLDFDSIDAIRAEVIQNAERLCKGWMLAFCTIEGVAKWADAINDSKIKYKRACIWVKPDSTPQLNGQGPAQGAECFVAAWAGDGHAHWNAGGKRGIYTHNCNWPERIGSKNGGHPTEKPLNLMSELIMDFTKQGETILDPFMGSGSTGAACAKMNRKFIGIEMNEKYFDLACQKIEATYAQPSFFIPEHQQTKSQKLI